MARLVRDKSLRFKAPLAIAATLLAGVAAFGALAYDAVSRSFVATAELRMASVAAQVAAPSAQGQARERRAREIAAHPAIRAALARPSQTTFDAARAVLRGWAADSASLVSSELRDSTGGTILTAFGRGGHGRDIPGRLADTLMNSAMFARGDSVLTEIGAPVRDGDRVIGRVSQVRNALTNTGATLQRTRELLGLSADAVFLVGNADGSLWVDLTQRVTATIPTTRGSAEYTRDGVARVASVMPYPSAPLVFVLEVPRSTLHAPARRLLVAFISIGLVVVAIGVAIGWWMTSGLTGDLVRLTDSAEEIARGNLSPPSIATDRRDEIGRLGVAFTHMRDSVRAAHDSLEAQVAARTAELRRAQETLVKKEKLATLGQLSSSVGHELRNPLGVMTNAVYFLEMTLSEAPAKVREYLGILRSQIRLSEKIVADLLDFARTRPPQRATVKVADLVQEQLGRVTIPASVKVDRSALDPETSVQVDPVQIGQVLLNLFTNAVQAMEDTGGTLFVRTRSNGTSIHVDIIDTGAGIAADNINHVFEPLFTTKARGIGLGLSVSQTLAGGNGGTLSVASEDGKGATFTLTLPLKGA